MKILSMTDFINNPQVENLNHNIANEQYRIYHFSSNQGGWMPVKTSSSLSKNLYLKKYITKTHIIKSLPYVWSLNVPFSARKLIKKKQIDIIHSHYIFYFSKSAYFNKLLSKIPWVLSIRGFTNDFGSFLLNSVTNVYYRSFLTKMVNDADYLIVQSKDTLNRMQKAGIPYPKRVAIITNGIDTNFFYPKKRENYDQEIVIGFVGRIINLKGVWELLFAFKQLLEDGFKFKLDYYGAGNQEMPLKRFVNKDLVLKDQVRFRGFCTNLLDVYHLIDIFILPSETEGSPNSMMEAMACGVPVITSNVGAVPDILGSYPFIIDPRSIDQIVASIKKLAEKRDSLREIGFSLRKIIVEKYNWQIVANKTRRIFDQVI